MLRVILNKAHRTHIGLVDGQADLTKADRLGGVIEDDLAGRGNDESDLVQRLGKVDREIPPGSACV